MGYSTPGRGLTARLAGIFTAGNWPLRAEREPATGPEDDDGGRRSRGSRIAFLPVALKHETVTPGSGNEPHTWLSPLRLRRLDPEIKTSNSRQWAMCEALRAKAAVVVKRRFALEHSVNWCRE
jgi:hypothetical protein